MKLTKIFIALLFIACVGGLGYLAVTDIPLQQNEVSKEIPHERFVK